MTKTTSIIIPTRNGLPLLRRCIEAIRRHTDPAATPYEIVVVDDASADGTALWCREEGLAFIRLPLGRGFPAACNAGMRLSAGNRLLLMNNDVTATYGWLQVLNDALDSDPEAGIAGPVSNYVSGRQQVEVPFADMDEFHRIARANNVPDPRRREEAKRLIGFCMLVKREVYDRIGPFDERFSPGHYEDDDYCMRARQAGYRLLICRDALVHHEGSATFRELGDEALRALVERNRGIYIDKWNTEPAV